jgi:hypothetical protein
MAWLNEMKAHHKAEINTCLEKAKANPEKTKASLDEMEATA